MRIVIGILLPFFGTALGAAAVFFLRSARRAGCERALNGLAAGVMSAASIWSLLLPAIEQAEDSGAAPWLPAALGFWAGALLLMGLGGWSDRLLRKRPPAQIDRSTRLMILAVVLHNLPEGMAVGAAFAGVLAGSAGVTVAGAMALSLGIAIQNLPEGAIISLPLHAAGFSRRRACLWGVLSGAVEPVGAVATLLLAQLMTPLLPYMLSLAAGAMFWVVMRELAPSLSEGDSKSGMLLFTFGFTLMMALDVALG